jgi:hypothetical protein
MPLDGLHTNTLQQFSANAVRLEVDERGGPDIERKPASPEESGTSARLTVCFENNRRKPPCLQSRGRRHARNPSTDNGHVMHRGTFAIISLSGISATPHSLGAANDGVTANSSDD